MHKFILNNKFTIFLAAFFCFVATDAFATLDCQVLPDASSWCDEKGYIMSEADCSGTTPLKCPLDKSKIFCNISNEPVEKECEFGDILYADRKCYNGNIPGNFEHTPIAVVVDPYNHFGLALHIEEFYMYEGHHPASSPYISNIDQENLTYSPERLEYWYLDSYHSGEGIEYSGFLRVDGNYFFDIIDRLEEFSKYTIPGVTALDSFYLSDKCSEKGGGWFVPTIGAFAFIALQGAEGIERLNNVLRDYHPLINAELDAAEGIDASGYHISEIPTLKYSDSFALQGYDEIPDEAYVYGHFPMAKIIVESGGVILGFTSTTAAEAIEADPTGNVLRCMIAYRLN